MNTYKQRIKSMEIEITKFEKIKDEKKVMKF